MYDTRSTQLGTSQGAKTVKSTLGPEEGTLSARASKAVGRWLRLPGKAHDRATTIGRSPWPGTYQSWPRRRRSWEGRGSLYNRRAEVYVSVTVSPSPQSKDEENEKLHELRRYARDFRRQHTTDAEQFDWDSDDGDYGLAIGRLVVT
jgi:hypothetical protein